MTHEKVCVYQHHDQDCHVAEEDPFSDELDIEMELARLLHSGTKEDKLQDLDR